MYAVSAAGRSSANNSTDLDMPKVIYLTVELKSHLNIVYSSKYYNFGDASFLTLRKNHNETNLKVVK